MFADYQRNLFHTMVISKFFTDNNSLSSRYALQHHYLRSFMLTTVLSVINNLHLVSVTLRGIGRLVGMAAKSNIGLLGLDRIFNHLGL